MSYLWLKWIHILSSTVLFGTGLGIAYFQWMAWRSGEVAVIARVTRITVSADFVFTTPAVVVQLLTGVALLHTLSLPWSTPWVWQALVLYALTGACWLPVVGIQIQLARMAAKAQAQGEALPPAFHRRMRLWVILGWPAFLSVIAIFWLMVRKPV
ncbi:MAG: DUF2269 domain-containing protein [Lysobacterales bacterium]